MEIPIITIKSLEKDFDSDRLSEILEKLRVNDEKIIGDITENLRNHKNRNEIIDILGSLVDMQGVIRTHQNLYYLYRFNRDLVQLGSPIWSDPIDYIDDVLKFPTKTENLTINDIVYEYLEAQYIKGLPYDDELRCKPSKKNIETLLRYLKSNCNIYTFDLGGVYDCPAEKQKEYDDWLRHDHEIEVMRIL